MFKDRNFGDLLCFKGNFKRLEKKMYVYRKVFLILFFVWKFFLKCLFFLNSRIMESNSINILIFIWVNIL